MRVACSRVRERARLHYKTLSHSLTHTHTHSHRRTHTHTHTHTHILSLPLSLFLTHTLTHTHTLSIRIRIIYSNHLANIIVWDTLIVPLLIALCEKWALYLNGFGFL